MQQNENLPQSQNLTPPVVKRRVSGKRKVTSFGILLFIIADALWLHILHRVFGGVSGFIAFVLVVIAVIVAVYRDRRT